MVPRDFNPSPRYHPPSVWAAKMRDTSTENGTSGKPTIWNYHSRPSGGEEEGSPKYLPESDNKKKFSWFVISFPLSSDLVPASGFNFFARSHSFVLALALLPSIKRVIDTYYL